MAERDGAAELYERQHEIWPQWGRSLGAAPQVAALFAEWLGIGPGAHALDLGCGSGRELAALAQRGVQVSGIDRSAALIERARQRLGELGLRAQLRVGDLREDAAFGEPGRFELVYLWDSVLNVFAWDEARAVLARAARALRRGGWLVHQQLHEAYWRRPQPVRVLEGPELGPGRSERRYRFEAGVLHDEVSYFAPGAREAERLPVQRLRLFAVPELLGELRALGLLDAQARGSHGWGWQRAAAPGEDTPFLACAARRAP